MKNSFYSVLYGASRLAKDAISICRVGIAHHYR